MAAIVAGVDSRIRETLNRLGEQAGIIFQLKDDEIGLFGEEEVIGKPVGSDIRENKKTVIRSMLFQYADTEDKKVLQKCFGNPKAGEGETQKVKDLYEKYQIKSKIEDEVSGIMVGVWKDFESLRIREDSKNILKGLLEFNLSRSK
jgi:geranylgeranyl diphosphate synthase type I